MPSKVCVHVHTYIRTDNIPGLAPKRADAATRCSLSQTNPPVFEPLGACGDWYPPPPSSGYVRPVCVSSLPSTGYVDQTALVSESLIKFIDTEDSATSPHQRQ
jgi:hypothetical protein